jgi:hypothetical protein
VWKIHCLRINPSVTSNTMMYGLKPKNHHRAFNNQV